MAGEIFRTICGFKKGAVMYHLLIVDDERIARESVQTLLSLQDDLELELTAVDSAVKAVSILETERVDVAIVDINMPQMTGLELYDIVRKNWPQCKVVFLTGYSEFDYVYKVHKHARYVLKADREEILIEAVRESIQEIEHDMLIAQATLNSQENQRRTNRYQISNFICELLDGYLDSDTVTNELLHSLEISLDVRKQVYLILLRYPTRTGISFSQCQEQEERLCLLQERYLCHDTNFAAAIYRRHYGVLLVQPKTPLEESLELKRLSGQCSLFQNALQINSDLSAAILIPDQAMSFFQAIHSFPEAYNRIFAVEQGDVQFLSLSKSGEPAFNQRDLQELQQAVMKLNQSFDSVDLSGILASLGAIQSIVGSQSNTYNIDLMDVYAQISARLLRTVRRLDIGEQEILQLGIVELFNVSAFSGLHEAFSQMEEVVRKTFEIHARNRIEQQENLVSQIKAYIQRHLAGDTSITTIADRFHFGREHLMRVFKKEEGITILQYTNELKEQRAKELLRQSDMPIKEIAEVLGFNGAIQFNRFFRSKVGQSPQAYRDTHKE